MPIIEQSLNIQQILDSVLTFLSLEKPPVILNQKNDI